MNQLGADVRRRKKNMTKHNGKARKAGTHVGAALSNRRDKVLKRKKNKIYEGAFLSLHAL